MHGAHQLRRNTRQKAKKAGVPVFLVDPRNISRTCPRKDWIHCQSCGITASADNVTSRNFASGTAVNLPNTVIF
ncbi:transposase [Polycladomyces sp. WAk]|uniref:Transposase n=1 Tax=Polycladomyces zharkentensis TaxID=2807616 RepID=A0ABS2WJD1_9BACL|nr:transposase [Polycladomyces sp. WAk]